MSQQIPRRIGPWTATKLEQLSNYLQAFAKATQRARARYYIDAMAGCGECVIARTGALTPGSAWRALNATPAFTGIHLVEIDSRSAAHLRKQMSAHANVHVYQGDSNIVIPRDVLPQIPRNAPTLAFLDPTGAQMTWELVEALSRHRVNRKIELLILFAFDMFINRRMSIPSVQTQLDRFFGDDRWRHAYQQSLASGETLDPRRDRFIQMYMDRLHRDLGYQFVDAYGRLKNSRNRYLYHMIFATDHEAGQRIMRDVWSQDRAIPGDLFYQRTFDIEPPQAD